MQGANRRPARQIVLTPQMLAQLLHLQHTTGFGDRRRVVSACLLTAAAALSSPFLVLDYEDHEVYLISIAQCSPYFASVIGLVSASTLCLLLPCVNMASAAVAVWA